MLSTEKVTDVLNVKKVSIGMILIGLVLLAQTLLKIVLVVLQMTRERHFVLYVVEVQTMKNN